jgi:hypothetical protein
MPASKGRKTATKARRLSHTRQPGNLSTPEWQLALRREYGRAQAFTMENLGDEPVFSEFAELLAPYAEKDCGKDLTGFLGR